jgi:hypothetical protein
LSISTRPERRLEYELEQLLQHVEQHEPSNIGKRTLVERLLDDLRSSDSMRRKRAEDLAKKELGLSGNMP